MDLSSVPDELVSELHTEATNCLEGTLRLAIAADQRATTLTGVFGAGSVALLAAAATVLAGSHPSGSLVWGAGLTALLLFASALCCAWSARPSKFFVGGYEPKLLARAATARAWMLRCATEDIQMRIDANRSTLEQAAFTLKIGTLIAIGSVPAGLIAFLTAYHLS